MNGNNVKLSHVLIAIAIAVFLFVCGCNDDSNDSTVQNNLFSQPGDNGDATCGIRQTLISQKVLIGSKDFYDDILAMWQRIYDQTMTDYPDGMPQNMPDEQLTELFEKPLPDVYTEDAVRSANGGPLTPPSSILKVIEENGYILVQYYIDENALFEHFGTDFVKDELLIFAEVFPDAYAIEIDASASPEILRATFSDPESYYIAVVNGGMHWIGLTPTTVYDSLGTAPVQNTETFGKLNGDQSAMSDNSFSGLVLELQSL